MPAADGGPMALIIQFAPFVLIIIVFYFLMIRPQQQQVKKHQEMVKALKRGDTITLSNGMIGKVTRVENDEAMVEIAQGVNVRVVKSMISQVQTRTAIAANDTKSIAKS